MAVNPNAAVVPTVNSAYNGGPDYAGYVNSNPDLKAYYDANAATLAKGGIGNIDAFGQYHWANHGEAEGRTAPANTPGLTNQAQTATTGAVDTATQTSQQLYDQLTKTVQGLLDQSKTGTQAALDQAKTDNQTLTDQITKMVEATKSSVADQTKALTDQQGQIAGQIAAAVASLKAPQVAHAPDLSVIMANNRKRMAGAGATSITGPGGVDPSSLSLGKNTLLGT